MFIEGTEERWINLIISIRKWGKYRLIENQIIAVGPKSSYISNTLQGKGCVFEQWYIFLLTLQHKQRFRVLGRTKVEPDGGEGIAYGTAYWSWCLSSFGFKAVVIAKKNNIPFFKYTTFVFRCTVRGAHRDNKVRHYRPTVS